MADKGDRRERIARLLEHNGDEGEESCAIRVNGNHNVIAIGPKITISEPARGDSRRAPSTRPPSWHAELEGLIWQRVWDLSMTKDQFFELAAKKLARTHISSLEKISERDLGVLYEMMSSMRRPALD